jgi:hypothetical protein
VLEAVENEIVEDVEDLLFPLKSTHQVSPDGKFASLKAVVHDHGENTLLLLPS